MLDLPSTCTSKILITPINFKAKHLRFPCYEHLSGALVKNFLIMNRLKVSGVYCIIEGFLIFQHTLNSNNAYKISIKENKKKQQGLNDMNRHCL